MASHEGPQYLDTTNTQLLRADEVVSLLAISRRTLSRLIARGDLEKVVIGPGCTRFRLSDVARIAAGRRTAAGNERRARTR
jgi:predicted DNA-binding transcriptional regulator AlpA